MPFKVALSLQATPPSRPNSNLLWANKAISEILPQSLLLMVVMLSCSSPFHLKRTPHFEWWCSLPVSLNQKLNLFHFPRILPCFSHHFISLHSILAIVTGRWGSIGPGFLVLRCLGVVFDSVLFPDSPFLSPVLTLPISPLVIKTFEYYFIKM